MKKQMFLKNKSHFLLIVVICLLTSIIIVNAQNNTNMTSDQNNFNTMGIENESIFPYYLLSFIFLILSLLAIITGFYLKNKNQKNIPEINKQNIETRYSAIQKVIETLNQDRAANIIDEDTYNQLLTKYQYEASELEHKMK